VAEVEKTELAFWNEVEASPALQIPPDFADPDLRSAEVVSLYLGLDEAETQALLTTAHRAYGTGMKDLLLTALARAVHACWGLGLGDPWPVSATHGHGTGDLLAQIQFPALQLSSDAVINRRGLSERGFRFGHLEDLLARVRSGEVGAVVMLHDEEFTGRNETARLKEILEAAPFSLMLEPIPGELSEAATARLPVATYLEESDFVVNHEGELCRYRQALTPPKGVRTVSAWVRELAAVVRGATV